MRTANFIYQYKLSEKTTWNIHGTVTEKNDGKVSVSIHNAQHFHAAARYKAKALAQEIVKANFRHPAVQGVIYEQDKSLVNILLEKTVDLHAAYITYTKKWALKRFVQIGKDLQQPKEEWYKLYRVPFKYATFKRYGGEPDLIEIQPVKYDKDYYKMKNRIEELERIRKDGIKKFLDKEVRDANIHYNDSICKLSDRLIKKGVDVKKMTITTARVDINIEITIECNGIITRAWTIIAEGPIQRAHYRYLVK